MAVFEVSAGDGSGIAELDMITGIGGGTAERPLSDDEVALGAGESEGAGKVLAMSDISVMEVLVGTDDVGPSCDVELDGLGGRSIKGERGAMSLADDRDGSEDARGPAGLAVVSVDGEDGNGSTAGEALEIMIAGLLSEGVGEVTRFGDSMPGFELGSALAVSTPGITGVHNEMVSGGDSDEGRGSETVGAFAGDGNSALDEEA